jgi:hypothetical protein
MLEIMATHKFEFVIGTVCFAIGVLTHLSCWFLRTWRGEAMRRADQGLAEDGLSGVTVLGIFGFGGAVMLFIGAALVTVSIVAYAGF